MGYRTLVLLNNDRADMWENDPKLGRKIMEAPFNSPYSEFMGGRVLAVEHADVQTLAVIESFNYAPLAHTNWYPNQQDEVMKLNLLKDAADKLGYRLVRKSK